ncbi:MAG: methylmalonyl-CoA mutase family protein, partial [Actinomycetota bacterium]
NSFDEALALPTEKAARIALRTQQILAHETGAGDTPDPLAGSWYVESLTTQVYERAKEYIHAIDERGGAVASIEYMQEEIEQAAYKESLAADEGSRVVVGVNAYQEDEQERVEILRVDEALTREQSERLAALRAGRDDAAVKEVLEEVRAAARGTVNLLPPMREALRRMATVGEICGVLREVFGVYRPKR